jgi:GNAT superfamily N-acetyltransferase
LADDLVPFLEHALRTAEAKISSSLGKRCRIEIVIDMDEALMEMVQSIDRQKFRPELQYSQDELYERGIKKGFILFLVRCEEEPVATFFGYADPVDGKGFFLDSVATLLEGKGVSSILVLLALIYCYEAGYGYVQLYTEEEDEKGRRLRQFYEHLGFNVTLGDPLNGLCMKHDLSPNILNSLYYKYLNVDEENQRASPHPAMFYHDDDRS